VFDAITTAHSGLAAYRTWLDATSDNIANANTVTSTDGPAFQPRRVVARPTDGGGLQVEVQLADGTGRLAHQPDHPLADAQGMVRLPDVDMSVEMTSLLMAQRGYQANLAVVERARDAYRAALQLGRS
jgi:flagellar basal-body rod protein FlgC